MAGSMRARNMGIEGSGARRQSAWPSAVYRPTSAAATLRTIRPGIKKGQLAIGHSARSSRSPRERLVTHGLVR